MEVYQVIFYDNWTQWTYKRTIFAIDTATLLNKLRQCDKYTEIVSLQKVNK